MKIAIIGTRGIPNNYGGFEQFAEHISTRIANLGHEVFVFNPSYHTYTENNFKNVKIVRLKCNENLLGGAAHFFYDYRCYKYAIKNQVDIALMCGYGTSAFALAFINKGKTKLVTNMDGFEWKRAKYNFFTKKLLKWFEKISVKESDKIIADHFLIKEYYNKKCNINAELISYGAEIPDNFDKKYIAQYLLKPKEYFLVVARDEPENQIEFIISAWNNSSNTNKLCIVTNFERLPNKYKTENNMVFITGLYDSLILSNLRYYALASIHGHTVGGTNPSLLEAMASQSFIIAHDNEFHRVILGNNAIYFNTINSLSQILSKFDNIKLDKEIATLNNLDKIKNDYQWESVTNKYLELFDCLINNYS